VVLVSALWAADCGPSVEDSVRLNVTLLYSPNIIDNVRFSEEKRSAFPNTGREICSLPCDPVEKEGLT